MWMHNCQREMEVSEKAGALGRPRASAEDKHSEGD